MPATLVAAVLIAAAVVHAEPDVDRARKHLRPKFSTVTWGVPQSFDPSAVLEIGDGGGHGGSLGWVRFQPARDRINVLTLTLQEEREQYRSKWPPERATMSARQASMTPEQYATLLRDLAVIDAATIKPVPRDSIDSSSLNFWVQVRLSADVNPLLNLDWSGYWGSSEERTFSKPQAMVAVSREAISSLDFRDHTLSAEERKWVSDKFAHDWAAFEKDDRYWWVRERYLMVVGAAGDAAALPTLRKVLGRDPKDRCVYHAINAVTRIIGKDVRDKPVEEMDVETTRRKVLDLIADAK